MRSVFNISTRSAGIVLVTMLLSAPVVCAQQSDPVQLQQALAKAQGLLRQIAQQKGALEAEKATMQAQLANMENQLNRTQAKLMKSQDDLASSQREVQGSNNTLSSTQDRLVRVENRLKEVVEKYKALDRSHQETLLEKTSLENELSDNKQMLEDARKKNSDMAEINNELLEKLTNKSGWDALLESEPFSRIGRVRLENIQQDYRFRLEDARITDSDTN